MSDDALDYVFEEELKAERGYRAMFVRHVDGEVKRVSTFPDTPEWREAADQTVAEFADDPTVDKVWHSLMGTGTSAGSLVRGQPVSIRERGGQADESPRERPSPASLPCCTPEKAAGPSGVRLRHNRSCRNAGEPVRVAYAPALRRTLRMRHAIETRRAGLDTGPEVEAAGGILTATDGRCPAHPAMDVDGCPTCSDRRVM